MFIAIVISACLQKDAATCKDELIEFKGGPMACVVAAQPIVAEWGGDHPDWQVKSWKCSSR